MCSIEIPEAIDHNRRRFFGTAAMTLAATQLGMFGSADAQSSKGLPATKRPSTQPSPAGRDALARDPELVFASGGCVYAHQCAQRFAAQVGGREIRYRFIAEEFDRRSGQPFYSSNPLFLSRSGRTPAEREAAK